MKSVASSSARMISRTCASARRRHFGEWSRSYAPRRPRRPARGPGTGHVPIGGRHRVPSCAPVDRIPRRLAVELAPELPQPIVERDRRPPPVQVRHRKVDHPAVAPESRRMEREARRKEPQLGRDRMQALPVVKTQHRERELSPRRRGERTAMRGEKRARPDERGIVGSDVQEPERDVGQDRREDVAFPLDVQAPSTVAVLVERAGTRPCLRAFSRPARSRPCARWR